MELRGKGEIDLVLLKPFLVIYQKLCVSSHSNGQVDFEKPLVH